MVVLTTFPPPEEGIEYRQAATEAHVGSTNLGTGTLYVAQRFVKLYLGEQCRYRVNLALFISLIDTYVKECVLFTLKLTFEISRSALFA